MGYDLRTALDQYTRDPEADLAMIDAVAVTSRVRRRRAVRVATVTVVSTAAVTVVAVAAYGLTNLLMTVSAEPVAPAASSSAEPVATPTSQPTPTPEPAADPSPSASGAGVVDGPVFRSGGRVADFPSNAPEKDVVVYLKELLGTAPAVSDSEFACVPSALPGSFVDWPEAGLALRVRTTDDAGKSVDPYVAAWILSESSTTQGLVTDAGLFVGATRERVLELYPNATPGERDYGDGVVEWWYEVDGDTGLLIRGAGDDPVYRIESGFGCGE